MTLSSTKSSSPSSFANEIFEFDLLDLMAIFITGISIFLFNALGIISPLTNNLERVGNDIKISLTENIQTITQITAINRLPEIYEQNQELTQKVVELESELAEAEIALAENRELLNQLDAEGSFSQSYSITPALVVNNTRLSEREIVLNKGDESGISVGDVVVINELLIGLVTDVNPVSSAVSLLGADSTKIPVKTADTEVGILDLNENGELVVTQILQSQEIKVGDRLYSAGLDQQVPPDLYLGEVKSVTEDERASTKSAVISRPINLQNIQRVFILDLTNE